MNAHTICPGEPEQANGKQDGTDHGTGKTLLGRRVASAGLGNPGVPLVCVHAVSHRKHHAHGDTKKGKPADTRRPAALLLEDYGEGGKHHV